MSRITKMPSKYAPLKINFLTKVKPKIMSTLIVFSPYSSYSLTLVNEFAQNYKKNFYSYSPKEILPVYPGAAELYKTTTTTTMAEGEPLRKKQKKVEDDIFHTFHDKYSADDMSILHMAYKTLFQKESSLITYSIRFCNAHQPVEFTDAYLDLEEHIDVIYPIGGIFESGLSVLRNFLKSKEIPEDHNIQRILSTLLTYLLDQGISLFTGLPPYT